MEVHLSEDKREGYQNSHCSDWCSLLGNCFIQHKVMHTELHSKPIISLCVADEGIRDADKGVWILYLNMRKKITFLITFKENEMLQIWYQGKG